MTYALEIDNLHKVYDDKTSALNGIDLRVQNGDFFALLGPNGAGKSTTIGILFSLVNKTAGSVKVYGIDIDKDFPLARAHMGLVPQETNFNQFHSVVKVVGTQAGYYGIPSAQARQRTEKYLKKLGLWDKKDTEVRALSGGMKRRLMIARALVHEPKLLVLDEPTAGVDIEIRHMMWDFMRELNEQGTTIILTTHYLEEAEHLCRNVAIIHAGSIAQSCSMRALLDQLEQEHFIFYLADTVTSAPRIHGAVVSLTDKKTLEISIHKKDSLNDVFKALEAENIRVLSMRNKTNRLEQSFLKWVGKGNRNDTP